LQLAGGVKLHPTVADFCVIPYESMSYSGIAEDCERSGASVGLGFAISSNL
jgi:hypothetical protein